MVTSNLARLQSFEEARIEALRQYPSARAFAQYSLQRDETAAQTDPVNSEKIYYNADVVQPLYYWGALRSGARIGAIRAEIAANNMVEAFRLLALEIRRDFLQLVILKQSLDNARFERELAERRRKLTQARIAAGEIPSGMLEPAENAIAQAELGIDRASYALDSALERFRRLSGREAPLTPDEVPDQIPALEVPAEPVVVPLRHNYVEKKGWEGSAQMKNARLGLEMLENYRRIERTTLRPKVDLVAGTSQDERSYTLDVSRRDRIASLFVGVRVSWNIFDSFANKHRLRARAYNIAQEVARTEQMKQDLISAVEGAAREVEFAERALTFAERGYRLSASGVAVAESNVKSGRGAEIDVEAARSGERAARVSVFQSRAAYLNANARLLSLVDQDPLTDLAARDENPP